MNRSNTSIARIVFLLGLLMIVAAFLTGCAAPTSLRVEYEHISHPFAGPPFGDRREEDALNAIDVVGRWQSGRLYAELALGYSVTDSGFFGPRLLGSCRVGVELWSRPKDAPVIVHFELGESTSGDWLRQMRTLELEGDLEFSRQPRPIVSRDFVTGAADAPEGEDA